MQLHEAVKKNKLGLNRSLSAIFISILIFSIYNRTFSLGFDIRFLVFPFFISSLILALLVKIKFDDWVVPTRAILLTLLFILIMLQDQIAWQFSALDKNAAVYKNVIILYIYNFLIAIYFFLNRKYLNGKVLINSVLLSSLFLSLSCLYQAVTGNLPFVSTGSSGEAFEDKLSLLGVRPSGYAHDPNYTSLLMVFSIYIIVSIKKTVFNRVLLLVCLVTLFASGSKTVLLISSFLVIRLIFIKLKIKIIFNIGFVTFILFGAVIAFSLFEHLSTFSQRLVMWRLALDGFYERPILGYGITGVRSLLELSMRYVQPHNGWLAILVDHGIVLFTLIVSGFTYMLFNTQERANRYLIIIFCFLSISNEMWVYPYWILFFVVPFVFNIGDKRV
ncbi:MULTISPECIES: O-antigen ligase family protein [Pseudoalteromonas]|uniref:O-antigen ligase family protein n=1 Tax=Pseudoalteromonas TaxID=53246 RepID=UPI0018CE7332|nr:MULTISPECIES: O-antigen ligase family protein [Pseudoalteromonas]MBH0075668.1 O-antigen ligase family protein [Pseudoalteromonas sp. SWYJ118]